MDTDNPVEGQSPLIPYYQRIYNFLEEEISSGRLKAGDRVFSEKELSEKFGVSRITSKRALEKLAEQGLISRSPGKGSFVLTNTDMENGNRSLASKTVAFLIADFGDSFGTEILKGIEETCRTLGYHLIIKRTLDSVEEEDAALNSLAGVAGIILEPSHGEYYNPEILKMVLNKKPMVFVDRKMRGLAIPSVSTDNAAAVETGITHLLKQGHRNIAFFSGPVEYTSTLEDRRLGFLRAFTKMGITYNSAYFCSRFTCSQRYPFYDSAQALADQALVKEHLSAYPEISAAFAAEYTIGLIIKNALDEMGLSIPADFSILSYDEPRVFTGLPFFTHLCQDQYLIGKKAMEILHGIIVNPGKMSPEDIHIPAKLITGLSIAPPAKRFSR